MSLWLIPVRGDKYTKPAPTIIITSKRKGYWTEPDPKRRERNKYIVVGFSFSKITFKSAQLGINYFKKILRKPEFRI